MNMAHKPPPPTMEAPQPAPPRPPIRPAMSRADREFLPAALEILEQPPSPVSLALLLGICLFAAAALAWAWLGHTDIVAVAHGKVQPTGKVKVVQPLEPGMVRAIRVQNGALVQEGDVLIELDPGDALAEARAAEAAFVSWTAEALRRADAITSAAEDPVQDRPSPWPDGVPEAIREREDAVRIADVRKLAGDLVALAAQAAQKRAEQARLADTIEAQSTLIATQQERVDMRTSLLASNAGTRASVLDATESLNYQRTVLAGQRGQLAEAERALEAIAAEHDKVLRAFVAEQAVKRAEARRQADEAEQRLARARLKVERMTLRSPASGTAQGLTVTSLGQVLRRARRSCGSCRSRRAWKWRSTSRTRTSASSRWGRRRR